MVGDEGRAFLKIATATPDFESIDFEGIPDGHSGPTVCIRSFVTTQITANPGMATYIICTPQAGVSHWTTEVPTGTDWINGQPLAPTLFPKAHQIFLSIDDTDSSHFGGDNSAQISRGRLASSAVELSCLNNAFNQYGSITSWKVPLETETILINQTTGERKLAVAGINGVKQALVASQAYVRPVRDGVYAVSMNRNEEFNFFPIRDGETSAVAHPAFFNRPAVGPSGVRAMFNGPLVLWDNNFDTIVVRIDVPEAVTAQSFVFSRWVTFEAQPVFNSLLWDTAHLSPEPDYAALNLYREMCRQLPMAVAYKDNPGFWSTVLGLVEEASSALSFVPGPIGGVAKGVHAISEVLKPLTKRKKGRARKTQTKKITKVIRRSRKRGAS
jgi:hypothetical protein